MTGRSPSGALYPNLQDTNIDEVSPGKRRESWAHSPSPVKNSPDRLHQTPVHTDPNNASVSTFGVLINIVLYGLDIFFDCLLALTLYRLNKAEEEGSIAAWETNVWFIVTVVIIVVPMVVINLFSFVWYLQNKVCLGDYCIMRNTTTCRKVYVFLMHALLLGQFVRYFDQIHFKRLMEGEKRTVKTGPGHTKVTRLSPKGEVYAVLQMVISRDSAMLDMIHAFLQDGPQLIFQIFLLYRSPDIITSDPNITKTVTIQSIKIVLALFSLAFALISYQEELRRGLLEKPKKSLCSSFVCLLWRMSVIAARVITISSFAAIVKDGEPNDSGTGWLGYEDRADPDDPFTFPAITGYVFGTHWILMTLWIHSQKSNFCADPHDGSPRHCHELLYSIVMGWVHIFCFLNHKESPARKRMAFFYVLTFLENTVLIGLWYYQVVVVTELWFRVAIAAAVEGLFLFGALNMLLYYGFLHPENQSPRGSKVTPFDR